eukprot:snap_masked-scaffold_11-processed-gene-11.5-mRNA-1 protein AED:0.31 eAED:0.31 QI:0/-1/0/1/-1/1/1/0/390
MERIKPKEKQFRDVFGVPDNDKAGKSGKKGDKSLLRPLEKDKLLTRGYVGRDKGKSVGIHRRKRLKKSKKGLGKDGSEGEIFDSSSEEENMTLTEKAHEKVPEVKLETPKLFIKTPFLNKKPEKKLSREDKDEGKMDFKEKVEEITSSSSEEYDSASEESVRPESFKVTFIKESSRSKPNVKPKVKFDDKTLSQERRKETERAISNQIRENNAKIIDKLRSEDEGLINSRQEMPSDEILPQEEKIEYKKWRIREFKRVQKSFVEAEEAEKEKQELARRKAMTDEELIAEMEPRKEKAKLQFLQKYYHKGAFYMDEETKQKFEKREGRADPRRQDWQGATADDRRNMEILPEIMQRKNFGKKSQSKWTHLANEDTSKGDNLWAESERNKNK